MHSLLEYTWPGNVRELQNVIERMVSLSVGGPTLSEDELPEEIRPGGATARRWSRANASGLPFHEAKARAISDFEVDYLREILVQNRGNISQAARQAGIDRKTIHRMLQKYEIDAVI
jgi:transcriptional regulator of acetoin/glycerol metabolism